ncbi:type II toxin-antitoxin system HigB family toxin [Crocosphaera sp. UHCC 0190]|uniref:type II toxin-antitoxin system HigB family toxin n=1 Tax=Crocosphaera sp. UHCC 0190 TaxID=3110246 RepID=UPI002B2090E6|nr:type II toxin-antitoxin system HigB family toxin [Crocosphaera sp. UHCC 0190]MEA5508970.1 type II toxin-antitoxin system HigB family toxin [Crocosphaera sp. UHCC 0190]
MRVINDQLLANFSAIYPEATVPLDTWLQVAKQARWKHLFDIKITWNRATDDVDGKTVFNIGGNKYRLIATINYKLGIVKIDYILTHQEYNRGNWKTNS